MIESDLKKKPSLILNELSSVLHETFNNLRKTEFNNNSEKWEPSSEKEYKKITK